MISLIICTRELNINQTLLNNIKETIGIEYELIILRNIDNKYSIFSAYNEGVLQAKYPYLCFMHDDILYHTNNWGKNVIAHFQDETKGLIGVAGGHYLPGIPASWWSTHCVSEEYIQGYISEKGDYAVIHKSSRRIHQDKTLTSVQAVAVDGFWFCIPRRIFDIIHFDDKNFNGWHAYDLDICMQVIDAGFQIHIVYNILIEHFSIGNVSEKWFCELEKFYKKWQDKLPLVRGMEFSETEIIDRNQLLEDIYMLNKENIRLDNEIERIHYSKAYRLGKFILRPLSFVKYVIVKLMSISN